LVGYPAALTAAIGHPVIWIGTAIAALERRWNHSGALAQRVAGVTLLLLVAGLAGAAGWVVTWALSDGAAVAVLILVATTGLAQRSLDDHVRAVAAPLAQGDLAAARVALACIVGRDTGALDEQGVALAATESLAESFCDGVVAPAFWFLIGGLPGLFAYKAINTADSMIGHRDDRYLYFGWAAARSDDLANFVPARLAGLLISCAGARGLATMWRDARLHASPNAGWPEAAMAGVLGKRLGGPVSYDGEPTQRPWIGDGAPPSIDDLKRALWTYRRACLLLWALVGGIAWLP
jgi:adenosylcobinamide-phosphate synthase